MDAEAQAVEIGAGTEHAVMVGEMTRNIDQRLRRVGLDKDRRHRRDLDQPWHDILEHLYIGIEKTKPSGRILAVRGATCLLIDAGGEDDETGTGEVVIVPSRTSTSGESGTP